MRKLLLISFSLIISTFLLANEGQHSNTYNLEEKQDENTSVRKEVSIIYYSIDFTLIKKNDGVLVNQYVIYDQRGTKYLSEEYAHNVHTIALK